MSSFLGSVKSKLSRKGSNRSTKSNVSATSQSQDPKDNIPSIPPPAYSELDGGPSSGPSVTSPSFTLTNSAGATSQDASGTEDPYSLLSTFDTVFLIDDSGSMSGSRWWETREVLRMITPICTAHDTNGIDIHFLNDKREFNNIRTPRQVEDIFNSVLPRLGTPTGTRLSKIISKYIAQYEAALNRMKEPDPYGTGVKPLNMIVITDGEPTDDVDTHIIKLAKKLDALGAPPNQLGIQFFQVGNDPGAAEALAELDDALGAENGIRDMVDTVTWNNRETSVLSASAILKVVLGAVIRRLDRRRASGESGRSARRR